MVQQGQVGRRGMTFGQWVMVVIIALIGIATVVAVVLLALGVLPLNRPAATPMPVVATLTAVAEVPPTTTPTPTHTPEVVAAGSQPDAPSAGIPVAPGQTLPKGQAVIVREIDWNASPVKVWIWWGSLQEATYFGDAWDGVAGHRRDGWTSADGQLWTWMATDACLEAQQVKAGGLGSTNVVVHFQQEGGGFGDVPAPCGQPAPAPTATPMCSQAPAAATVQTIFDQLYTWSEGAPPHRGLPTGPNGIDVTWLVHGDIGFDHSCSWQILANTSGLGSLYAGTYRVVGFQGGTTSDRQTEAQARIRDLESREGPCTAR